MQWHVWLTFFAACWVIAISPGSGAVLSMSHGLSYGWKRSSATIAGLQLGLALIFIIAGAGVGSLLVASETAFLAVKLVGAAYLMYLGVRQMRMRPASPQAIAEAESALTADPAHHRIRRDGGLRWQQRMLAGFLTNATNPKGILFMVAVLPPFIDPNRPLLLQLLILGGTLCCVDVIVMNGYAASASLLSRWLRGYRAQLWQNRIFGGLLVLIGAGLLAVRRSSAS
ncbi:lysine transporter LysE [Corticibacter populi]|uniref:Lysine transporter LysE n=1 Tax=Corticibacter populi TaxID=1550736 RepID=A0A3M6QU48_9BURK|nr:LysE family transporter [Corticibacter populi]RMX06555.1 lysine transporter LysE [Corticibacter populi]RZS31880.1 homoserine/homoserine lactone efflux protein [Corticibacter populi]